MLTIAASESSYSGSFHEIMAREKANNESVGKILSRREQQVLTYVIAAKTSREIAQSMGLSVRTVEFHRSNLVTKLGAKTTGELLVIAEIRKG